MQVDGQKTLSPDAGDNELACVDREHSGERPGQAVVQGAQE